MKGFCLLTMVLFLSHFLEGKLPDFIKPCRASDPNFSRCLRERTKEIVPIVAEGVKEFNIPSLKKIKLPPIHSPYGNTYSLIFDGILEGLESLYYADTNFNYQTFNANVKVFIPQVRLSGRSSINGYLGNLPVFGDGHANITLSGLTYVGDYTFATLPRNGTTYFRIYRATLNWYEVKSASYHFTHLFKGSKERETELNQFLNRNWELLADVFAPHVGMAVTKLIADVGNVIIASTPSDQVLLP